MLFSIVIPTYNRLASLQRALQSVWDQGLDDYEVVIVDDGSEDGTRKYIAGLEGRNIRYVWQENSGLPAVARNRGIDIADGDWVAFLDSDDIWYPEKLASVARVIKDRPEVIAVSHWEDLSVDGEVRKVLKHGSRVHSNIYEDLLFNGNCFSTSAMVVRRDKLRQVGGFDVDPRYYIVEDYELWLRLARSGSIFSLHEVLGQYRIADGDNISADIELIHDNLRHVISDHIKGLGMDSKREQGLLRRHLARVEYYRGRSYQLAGRFNRAIPVLAGSLFQYPFAAKKWLSFLLALARVRRI